MKLVVITSSGDGYTFSCECVRPVEYESAEAFIVHLEETMKAHRTNGDTGPLVFAGHSDWSIDEFGYSAPTKETRPYKKAPDEWKWDFNGMVEVLTVDEWFTKAANGGAMS